MMCDSLNYPVVGGAIIISCCSLELCPTDIGMSVMVDGSDSTRLSGSSFGEAAHFSATLDLTL